MSDEHEPESQPPTEPQPPSQPVDEPKRVKLAKRREGARSFQPGLWIRLIPAGAAVVYLAFFIGLNTRRVEVKFVFTSTHVSLIWVVLLSGGLGIVLGVLLSQLYRFRRRAELAAREALKR